MARFDDPSVLCPFYREENAQSVICEGPNRFSKVHLCFTPPSKKKEFKRQYCMAHYRECELARALYRMWEEKESEE